jgi:hypothetical protein
MSWLRTCATLLLLGLSPQAFADEWKVLTREADARLFVNDAATPLRVGDAAPETAVLQVDAHVLLGRGDDALSLSPLAKLRFESANPPGAFVRLFDGGIGVVERDAPDKNFEVATADAIFAPKGAEFGVYADRTGTMLSVREGLVQATDLATHTTVDVRAGETFRALRNLPATVQAVVGVDPATQAAHDAEHAAQMAPSLAAGELDRVPTGALPGSGAKGDPKLAEDAADAVHDQRKKARLGKADPRAVAAAERIERELWQEVDVESEPWSDDFKWTQVEDGEIRLKPISRIVLGLKGAEAFEFWALTGMVCLLLGGIMQSLMKEAGFGALGNAVLVATAFAAAIVVRDLFFRGGGAVEIEPFLSMGLMMGATPLLLLSGAFAKQRWSL